MILGDTVVPVISKNTRFHVTPSAGRFVGNAREDRILACGWVSRGHRVRCMRDVVDESAGGGASGVSERNSTGNLAEIQAAEKRRARPSFRRRDDSRAIINI